MPQIRIESILGGQAPTSHFAGTDQFRASLGIDPALPIDDTNSEYSTVASGVIRPHTALEISAATLTSAPLWIKGTTKTSFTYICDADGGAWTVNAGRTALAALADGGALNTSLGNGCEYYDNHMYFAKNLDICRYGPLDSTPSADPAFTGTYWTTTLGLTALINTTYPTTYKNNIQLPNHPMCRHSNGRLYFGDVVGNQGTIHYIQTTKTNYEGDTDDGSTYDALNVGYGLWPTVLESYGSDLAIAFYEGESSGIGSRKAKIAFWDTTSTDVNKIVWSEFPDNLITAMKNINGILYVVSGNTDKQGFRLSRFIGGYSFEEVYKSETGEPCLAGAIDGLLNYVLMGSYTNVPTDAGCVYSKGLSKSNLSNGVFNVIRATNVGDSTCVTAVGFGNDTDSPLIGWTQAGDGSTAMKHGIDKKGTKVNTTTPPIFWSQLYRIGQHFKITKIRIPLMQKVSGNMGINVKVKVDSGTTTYNCENIGNATYPNKNYIEFRADSSSETMTGRNDFFVEFRWTSEDLLTIGLPIIIEFDLTDE